MELIGLDVVGADEGGLIGTGKELGAKAITAAADFASSALKDDKKDEKKDDKSKTTAEEPGFFSRTVVGPVRVWHALLGVVGLGGGIYLWKRK